MQELTLRFLDGLRIGAHRGLADDAPENTLAAFRHSKALGADAVELDVEFSKDGVAVLLHDDDVDRSVDEWRPATDRDNSHIT